MLGWVDVSAWRSRRSRYAARFRRLPPASRRPRWCGLGSSPQRRYPATTRSGSCTPSASTQKRSLSIPLWCPTRKGSSPIPIGTAACASTRPTSGTSRCSSSTRSPHGRLNGSPITNCGSAPDGGTATAIHPKQPGRLRRPGQRRATARETGLNVVGTNGTKPARNAADTQFAYRIVLPATPAAAVPPSTSYAPWSLTSVRDSPPRVGMSERRRDEPLGPAGGRKPARYLDPRVPNGPRPNQQGDAPLRATLQRFRLAWLADGCCLCKTTWLRRPGRLVLSRAPCYRPVPEHLRVAVPRVERSRSAPQRRIAAGTAQPRVRTGLAGRSWASRSRPL